MAAEEDQHTALTRRTALLGGAGVGMATLLAACGGSSSTAADGSGVFNTKDRPKFVFVNHVTTNPFFSWARNGAHDACELLGCSYQWTGSATSSVPEMLNAFEAAITQRAAGIAVALTDQKAFDAPVKRALDAGIPVVSYNADAKDSGRLSYIGQDLFLSGQETANRIVAAVGSGPVALFVATPGSSDLQPRVDGVKSVLDRHPEIDLDVIATGASLPGQLSTVDAYVAGHPKVKGLYSVDGGSTQAIAQTVKKRSLRDKGVKAGGYDLNPLTRKLLAAGELDFAIDQQPYLQGFLPVLQLFLYRTSGNVTGLGDVNTGMKFIDRQTIKPYNDAANSRYG